MRKRWTVWRIRNRWLRAAVTWALLVASLILLLPLVVAAFIQYGLRGVWGDIGSLFIDRYLRAALMGKDAPK